MQNRTAIFGLQSRCNSPYTMEATFRNENLWSGQNRTDILSKEMGLLFPLLVSSILNVTDHFNKRNSKWVSFYYSLTVKFRSNSFVATCFFYYKIFNLSWITCYSFESELLFEIVFPTTCILFIDTLSLTFGPIIYNGAILTTDYSPLSGIFTFKSEREDSNLRRYEPADLQSAAIATMRLSDV